MAIAIDATTYASRKITIQNTFNAIDAEKKEMFWNTGLEAQEAVSTENPYAGKALIPDGGFDVAPIEGDFAAIPASTKLPAIDKYAYELRLFKTNEFITLKPSTDATSDETKVAGDKIEFYAGSAAEFIYWSELAEKINSAKLNGEETLITITIAAE